MAAMRSLRYSTGVSVESPPRRLPHLDSVQALRGFATLGVLLAHLFMVEAKYSPDVLLGNWANLGHWGVDIFFVISGFIMVYVTWNTPRRPERVKDFLWRRATRIYPLYWIVSFALLVLWLWRPDMVFNSNNPDIVRGFLLFPQKNQPLLAVGWTLVYEVYFYLVFACVLFVSRRLIPPFLILWAIIVLAGWAIVNPTPEEAVLRHVLNPLTLEFIAGAGFGYWYTQASEAERRQPGLALLGLVVAVACVGAVYVTMDDLLTFIGTWGVRVSLFGVGAFAIFAAMLLSGLRAGRVSIWLGDISYSLYLTHVLSLTLIGRLAAPFLREGWVDNVLLIAVMIAGALLVGHLTYVLIERPILNWFRRRRRSETAQARAAH